MDKPFNIKTVPRSDQTSRYDKTKRRSCFFNREWMNEYKWVDIFPFNFERSTYAYCTICDCEFSISNKGKTSLGIHEMTKKHMKATEDLLELEKEMPRAAINLRNYENQIANGKFKLREKRGVSKIWSMFMTVYDEDDNILPVVWCKNCKRCYTYSSANGTSSQLMHLRKCEFTEGTVEATYSKQYKPKKEPNPTNNANETVSIQQNKSRAEPANSSSSSECEEEVTDAKNDIKAESGKKPREIRCGDIVFKKMDDVGDMPDIWDRFYAAYDKSGRLIPHVVCCRDCENVFRFDKRKDNSNLLNHLCIKKPKAKKVSTEADDDDLETEAEQNENPSDDDENEDDYDLMKTKRKYVKKMIESGKFTLERNRRARSRMWDTFYLIINEQNFRIRNYVCCIKCREVYKHTHSSGTSTRLKHPCVEPLEESITIHKTSKPEEQMEVTALNVEFTDEPTNYLNNPSYSSPNNPKENTVPDIESIKRDIMSASINFIVQDMRPVSIFSGEGYRNLARQLWQMGSEYGRQIDFTEIFPTTETIAIQLQRNANVLRNEIADKMKSSRCSGAAISIDISQDAINKRNFVGMNVHYIDNSKFVERSLCVKEINELSRDNVDREISTAIKSYAINPQTKLTIVADNSVVHGLDSNNSFDVIDCTASVINGIIEHATDNRILMRQQFETNLQKCYDLIDYLKVSKLDRIVLDNFKETKWNKKFYLFSNIINSWDAIETVLNQSNFEKPLQDVDKNLTKKLVEFLGPFQIALSEIEASDQPLLHLVVLWRKKLLDHLEVNGMDSAIIRNIKELAKSYLIDKWNLNIQHKVAVFLHPQLKSLRMFDPHEKADIFYETRKLSRQMMVGEQIAEQLCDSDDGNPLSDRKRIKLFYEESTNEACNKSTLLDFIDPSDTGTDVCDDNDDDEVSRYASALFRFDDNFDLCQWWLNKKQTYPQLYSLFIRIQCIPATISNSVQLLNESLTIAQDIINDSRYCMDPIDFDNIMLIKNHTRI